MLRNALCVQRNMDFGGLIHGIRGIRGISGASQGGASKCCSDPPFTRAGDQDDGS